MCSKACSPAASPPSTRRYTCRPGTTSPCAPETNGAPEALSLSMPPAASSSTTTSPKKPRTATAQTTSANDSTSAKLAAPNTASTEAEAPATAPPIAPVHKPNATSAHDAEQLQPQAPPRFSARPTVAQAQISAFDRY